MFADEGATLYSAHLSWSNLWAQSQHVDRVLLPYYVLIHFWVLISGNVAWVRALSLLSFFGTIVVSGWIGLRIAGRWCGIIASVLTATSTVLVEKSLNARPYELSSFLVVLCAMFLLKWLEDSQTRWLWAFSGFALLATAMQLFSLLAPVAMLFCVLLVRPDLIAQRPRVWLAPVAVLAVASCAWVIGCIREVGQVNWIAIESTGNRLLAEVRGPAVGQFYDFILIVIVVVAATKLAVVWNLGGRNAVVGRINQDRNILALTVGWAVIPTLVLSIVSFVHPVFSDRYVSASAPGVALLAAFICVRAFPRVLDPSVSSDETTGRPAKAGMMGAFGVGAAVLLTVGYFAAAGAQQEDLQGPAQFVAQNWETGDVIALPDHAITSAIDYYLASDKRQFALWPQLGVRQRYVEGFDLSLHPSGDFAHRVWLVADGSVAGVTHFEKFLVDKGYVVGDFKQFNGSEVLLYYSTKLTATIIIPADGATLSGPSALLDAVAGGHDRKLTKVQFLLSGGGFFKEVIGSASLTTDGAVLRWDTRSVPNGIYSLEALATDREGRSSYSVPISIKVHN
jgi:uncharacterized membrane protein